MLNLLKSFIHRLSCGIPGRAAVAANRERLWRRDPLAHPALRQMTSTQLADLPFDPAKICGESCSDPPK